MGCPRAKVLQVCVPGGIEQARVIDQPGWLQAQRVVIALLPPIRHMAMNVCGALYLERLMILSALS